MAFFEKLGAIFKIVFDNGGTKYNNLWLDTAYDWQTLITAVVAGVPAAIAAYLLWRQVADQRKENQRSREQQQIAARIKMPHALAQLSEYWKHCFRAIIAEDLTKKTTTLPNDALEVIMAAAPTVETDTFEIMRTLVTESQVFESRLRSAQSRPIGNMTQTLVVDVASLDILTDSLYDFARFETNRLAMTQPDHQMLSHQIYKVLDFDDKQCAVEIKRLLVESALKRHFRAIPPVDSK
ncbi:hypothetical protein [Mesorhizobium sp. M0323]|uniref:hypothetical protein n=1 Tax=Mesorhizobium sp. M0323 TaxID=2956938 RepID=UPI00333778A3